MYIQLYHRHHGLHIPIKHMEISCDFNSVYLSEDYINEELLLSKIPDKWLPVPEQRILLTVGNEGGAVGQHGLSKFRSWGKYFDAYVLELLNEPMDWWEDSVKN